MWSVVTGDRPFRCDHLHTPAATAFPPLACQNQVSHTSHRVGTPLFRRPRNCAAKEATGTQSRPLAFLSPLNTLHAQALAPAHVHICGDSESGALPFKAGCTPLQTPWCQLRHRIRLWGKALMLMLAYLTFCNHSGRSDSITL